MKANSGLTYKSILLKTVFIYILTGMTVTSYFGCINNPGDGKRNANTDTGALQLLKINEDHLILTKHARCRMECRHINENEIKEIIETGSINYNKSTNSDPRGPKYALEGYSNNHDHLRIIIAPENNSLVIVTCIDLDHEWQCPSCN